MLSIPDHADFAFDSTSEFSIEFYLKHALNYNGYGQSIIKKTSISNSSNWLFWYTQSPFDGVQLRFDSYDSFGNLYGSQIYDITLTENTWYKIKLVYNKTTVDVYLDDVLQTPVEYVAVDIDANDGDIQVYSGIGTSWFDEIKIYKTE